MTQSELNILNENGFVEMETGSSDNELLTIASKVGNILEHPNGEKIFTLTPKNEDNTIKGTFSYNHGFGKFPLHTDTAFLKLPVRYLLLHLVGESKSDTTFVPFIKIWELLSDSEKNKLERAIYIVKTKKEIFYSTLLFRSNDIEGFKYDPSCFFPFNKYANEIDPILQSIFSKIKFLNIKWTGNKTVIFDNWKNLHGRKSVENNKRYLKRIYINKL